MFLLTTTVLDIYAFRLLFLHIYSFLFACFELCFPSLFLITSFRQDKQIFLFYGSPCSLTACKRHAKHELKFCQHCLISRQQSLKILAFHATMSFGFDNVDNQKVMLVRKTAVARVLHYVE